MLDKEAQGMKRLVKPEKVYLGNPNYAYAFTETADANIGNIRETFFYTALQVSHKLTWSDKTDFTIDGKYHFEVGGRDKGQDQIAGLKNAYIAKDNIEAENGNQIPLWMFGLLY